MAGGKRSRLDDMRDAPADAAPNFLEPDDAPRVERTPPRLPQPCPVVPLGVLGKQIVFLDGLQQVVMEAPRSCDKGALALWFGDEWLLSHDQFQERDKSGHPNGKFNQDKAQMALVADCRAKGVFNPEGKVLGRGAHRPKADESKLVLHMGRRVLIAHADGRTERALAGSVRLGEKDVFFPAADALPPPADKPSTRTDGETLEMLLDAWNWKDPEAAILLLSGWIAQAFICGALDWRAHVWMVAPTGSGKSSLQQIIRAILDDWCLSTADTSEAGIRQLLGNDTLAVSVDEAEKHDNPERLQGVLNLVKKGSSGDKIVRGGADHKATTFTARSAFLLSSVLHATLRGEDRNRIAVLDMRKLPEDVPPLEMELANWRSVGRRMHRRMIEQWPRFAATLAAYRRVIGSHRFDGRWQDTYGTLLACRDLLLFDHSPSQADDNETEPGMSRVRDAVTHVLPLMRRGRVEAQDDTGRAIEHLMSKALPGSKGDAPENVGTWLFRAMEPVRDENDNYELVNETARMKLRTHGLRVMRFVNRTVEGVLKECLEEALVGDEGWRDGYLALAYPGHAGLQQLWDRTEWIGDGYKQSLGKVEGVVMPRKVRFNPAGSDNALLVPLNAFRGEE
jgi:hypothetical protein